MLKISAAVSALVLLMATSAQAAPVFFTTGLSGAAEAPPNGSLGSGYSNVYFDIVAHTMQVVVSFTGLTTGNTNAHIHCCTAVPGVSTAGVATTTPTFTGFPTGATSGFYDHTFDMTLASSYNAAFVTANGGSILAAETALYNGLLAGRAYLNIHTSTVMSGEIRGFLAVPEPLTLSLFGAGLAGVAALRRRRRTENRAA